MSEPCVLCDHVAAGGPPGGWVAEVGEWLVMGHPLQVPGWLCVQTRRHVESVADLAHPEAITLGPVLRWLGAALQETGGVDRVYSYAIGHSVRHYHALLGVPGAETDAQGPRLLTRVLQRDPTVVDAEASARVLDGIRQWTLRHPARV